MSVGAKERTLSGKYRLERELGRGGMGSVWLAEHLTLRSPVAIKLIDPEIAVHPEALSRFLREAQAAAALRSPHVVQILDHGVDDGVPFIVMELLEGESLATRLERLHRLTPADTARILTQVARAITRAHEAGIIHRDLKPDNVFLVQNDEDEIAKVLDFGVAKSYTQGLGSASGATRTGSVLGTPYYMSPEQAEGKKTLDHRTDIWALGVIAYECLLGHKPFEADALGGLLLAICAREMPVPSRAGAVPSGFDHWFARACSRDPDGRFATAKEAAQALRTVCGSADGAAHSAPYSAPGVVQAASLPLATTTADLGLSASRRAPKKSPAQLVALALLGLSVVGGGAFFVLRGGRPPNAAGSGSAASVSPPRAATPTTAEPPLAPSAHVPEPPAAAVSAPSAEPSAAPPGAATAIVRTPARATKAKPGSSPDQPMTGRTSAATPRAATSAPATPGTTPAAPPARPRVNLGI